MYEIHVGYEFEVETFIQELIKKVEPLIKDARLSNYHETVIRTREGKWRIEKDDSLINGAEFISPPQKMEESFTTMRQFFQYIEDTGSKTTVRCGCHTNISLTCRGKIVKINENKFLANINWRLLCALWPDRTVKHNDYCKYMSTMFKEIRESYTKVNNNLGAKLFNTYQGFIVKKVSKSSKKGIYYELRFPGGINYHKNADKIEATVKHFSEALMKSREILKDTKPNKKIISYINRLNMDSFPTYIQLYGTQDLQALDNLKYLNSNSFKGVSKQMLLRKFTNICYDITSAVSHSHPKLIKILNNKHVLYYLYKYMTTSSLLGFNYVLLNMPANSIKLTIPKDESDIKKLWVIKIYNQLSEKNKKIFIQSIKNKKVKKYILKLIEKKVYTDKNFIKKYLHKTA